MGRWMERTLWLGVGVSMALLVGVVWLAFYHAPVEREMGIVQKIFFFHMPIAVNSFHAFFLSFMASALYLWRRKPVWDRLAEAGAEVGLLLATLKWLPNAYYSAQRVKDQWVVAMTLSHTSYFSVQADAVRAQETLPTADNNAIFLSMLESVGFVGAGFFVLVAGAVGWYAVRHAIRSETTVTTTVTIAAWIWLSVRGLAYVVSLLGWPPGINVPCPVFNADGNDLVATMVIVSAGLHRGRLPENAPQQPT